MQKRIVLIFCLVLMAGFAYARPDYTNGQYWVWTNAVTASNALSYCNTNGYFPIIGMQEGIVATNNQQTTNWMGSVRCRELDGNYCFARMSEALLDYIGCTESNREAFYITYSPDCEECQTNWFTVDFFLQENGDHIILETGGYLLLE